MKPIVARWESWSGTGSEHLVLRRDRDDIVAESVVVAMTEEQSFGVWYRVLCDQAWRVRDVRIALVGEARALELSADGEGSWKDEADRRLTALRGVIDLDLSISPFTNTLPIRRLDLRPGQSAEIKTAYIRFPDLAVSGDPQRYTRLDANRYRYESLDSDFVRDIEVDRHGLVVSYPGLFRRTL